MQAGKDTTYERIKLYSAMPVERVSFADPLKDSAAALLDVTREELEWMKLDDAISVSIRVPLGPAPDYRYRTIGMTGRQYLQRYGTESHRDVFGTDFWRNQALDKCIDPEILYVITDVRFDNEARGINSFFGGGYLAHVVGPEGKAAGGHASEAVLDDELFQFEINNVVRYDNYAMLDSEVKDMLSTLGLLA